MLIIWFTIIAVMLATYVVLDGFDFGAGILHQIVARKDEERRSVMAAIGPLWDGNEVWLLASGGVLVYAFPRAYSAGFSGFYLPLMMVLWLLIMRGLSIEFRSKEKSPLWRSFWDGVFSFSSVLMAIVLGAALGNVIRGVPLQRIMDPGTSHLGYFFSGPLFTDFRVGPNPGVLDWYTVTVGVFALIVLAGHGAHYLNWKLTGPVQERSRMVAWRAYGLMVLVGVVVTAMTAMVRPQLYQNLMHRPITWVLVLLIVASLVAIPVCLKNRNELGGFLASAAFIVSMLAATGFGLYPVLLYSTLNPADNLTLEAAQSGPVAFQIGLFWWLGAMLLAVFYFTYLFRQFRGKVTVSEDGHGY